MPKTEQQIVTNYIPLSRKIFEHEFWKEERVFSRAEAWIDIVRSASWEEDNKQIINGKWVRWRRGQWPVSLRYLGDRWKWSRSKASKFLEDLRRENMIEIVTEDVTAQTLITVCKYDDYNPTSKKKGQQTRQQRDSEVTAKGQRRDKIKELKNEKELEEEYNGSPVGDPVTPPSQDEELFQSFRKWIDTHAPKVNQMREPITQEEYARLRKDFPGTTGKTMIAEVLQAMHNKKDLLKQYESANLTLRSWIRLRQKNTKTGHESTQQVSNTANLQQALKTIRGESAANDVR